MTLKQLIKKIEKEGFHNAIDLVNLEEIKDKDLKETIEEYKTAEQNLRFVLDHWGE